MFMDAVITPHRSLSRRGFIVLISLMTAINAITCAIFLAMGAGPIPIFLGLDLLAVIVAFVASNRAASRHERIQVTTAEVRVLLQKAGQEPRTVWVSPTAFTRVALVDDEHGAGDLSLRLSSRERPVARALSRPERLAFARALDSAIARARTGKAWG